MEAHMNQWRNTLTPNCAAVLWSRSQSLSGGLDFRKYTAPNGNAGSGQGACCALTHTTNTAQARPILVAQTLSLPRPDSSGRLPNTPQRASRWVGTRQARVPALQGLTAVSPPAPWTTP